MQFPKLFKGIVTFYHSLKFVVFVEERRFFCSFNIFLLPYKTQKPNLFLGS